MLFRWPHPVKRIRQRKTAVIARKMRVGRRNGTAVELTKDEMRVVFDRMTRRGLGMSRSEFLERLDAGTLPDSPIAEHLALLAGGPRAR